jgi:hypothetical protein
MNLNESSNRNTSITQHNNDNFNRTRNYFENLLYSELNANKSDRSSSNSEAGEERESAAAEINVQNQTDQAYAMQATLNEKYSDLKFKIHTLLQLNAKNNRQTVISPPSSSQKEQDEEEEEIKDSNKSSNVNSNKNSQQQLIVRSSDSPLKSIITGDRSDSQTSSNTSSMSYDENFISSLFNMFISYDFKGELNCP